MFVWGLCDIKSIGTSGLSAMGTGERRVGASVDGVTRTSGSWFDALATDHNKEYLMIDSTIVTAHQQAATEKKEAQRLASKSFLRKAGCQTHAFRRS